MRVVRQTSVYDDVSFMQFEDVNLEPMRGFGV